MGLESFTARLDEAKESVKAENILPPAEMREFLEVNKASVLLLDVQEPGSDTVPGSYTVSLATLFYKADAAMADFKDPKVADRPKDGPIVTTCDNGGRALLAAKVLVDYGFTNVKVMEGGVLAFKNNKEVKEKEWEVVKRQQLTHGEEEGTATRSVISIQPDSDKPRKHEELKMVKDGEAQADEQLKKLFKNKPEKLVVTVLQGDKYEVTFKVKIEPDEPPVKESLWSYHNSTKGSQKWNRLDSEQPDHEKGMYLFAKNYPARPAPALA